MRILSLQEYADEAPPNLQFEQQPRWLQLLHKHCWPERSVGVYGLTASLSEAWLPLARYRGRLLGLKPRILEGFTGLYSSHYQPPTTTDERLEALLEQVLSRESWDLIRFSAVDKGGALHRALAAVTARHNLLMGCHDEFTHWYLKIDKMDFDAYYAQLPGALRNTLKRRGAKLEKEFQVRFDVCREPNRLSAALEDYNTVYSRSWKSEETHSDFIPELCQWAATMGWLRLGLIYLDGQPVAAQIWIVLNGRASIVKLAYDQQYQKLSVGSVLTARMMEQVMNGDRVTQVEYGKGGESYKRDWMSDSLQRIQLECYNPESLAGRCMSLRHYHLPALKRRLIK